MCLINFFNFDHYKKKKFCLALLYKNNILYYVLFIVLVLTVLWINGLQFNDK